MQGTVNRRFRGHGQIADLFGPRISQRVDTGLLLDHKPMVISGGHLLPIGRCR